MVTGEIFDGIHEIVLPAELDKPDDQAKKDVSFVDVKNPGMESSAEYIRADELSAFAAGLAAAVSGSSPLQQVPGVMRHRRHQRAFVLIRPLPGLRGMVASPKATGTRTRHRHMLPFRKAR